MNTQFLKDLSERLFNILPNQAQQLKKDLTENFQIILQNGFSKLDLVTREEFDAQVKVLARSRKKIEALEKRITELEKIINMHPPRE